MALATDAMVYGIAVPVLPKIAVEHGTQPLGVGVMFAVYAGALVLVTPLAGAWIDRRGNRAPMIIGMLGLAASTLLFAFLRDPGLLIAARALQGASAGLGWTAALALIATTHEPAERGKAMGIALSCFGVGTLLGPPVGGLLTDWFDPRAPFILAFVLAAVDGLVRWRFIPKEHAVAAPEERVPLRDRRGLVLVGTLTIVGAALIAFLEPILPLHLFSTADAGPGAVGLVFGVAALVASMVPWLAGSALRFIPASAMAFAGCVLAAGALFVLPRLDGVVLPTVALAVVTVGASLVLTPTLTLMADLAEQRRPPNYGAVYALYTLAYTGGLAVAPLAAGATMDAFGFGGAAATGAGFALVMAVVLLAFGRTKRSSASAVE
ncbi:MFS transporter [Sinosporangium album]|uniref:MFS transporter n=1 Tax=Sinosporangium album TaxID=504805 RepID=UPI0015A351AC|nr:MFS transporter [Sinosporangium album]